MGVGKTTLIKAICSYLGVKELVNSPSFAIINEYKSASSESIFHMDYYRIKNIKEAFDIGYEDYIYSDSYCFIEWPEKIEELKKEEADIHRILEEYKNLTIAELWTRELDEFTKAYNVWMKELEEIRLKEERLCNKKESVPKKKIKKITK